MKSLSVAALAAALAVTGHATDQVAQGSGQWSSITWSPGPLPVGADIVHIEGSFTVDYSSGKSPNFSRLYIGDNTGGLSSPDGTLEVSGGIVTVNANAAGAFIVGRSENSKGTLLLKGGTVRGAGNTAGAGMQIGLGAGSTGSVVIDSGELNLNSGIIVGFGDHSTGHFTVKEGSVTVGNNAEGGSFNIGGRVEGASTTATYEQTGGSVTVANNYFRIGYAGSVNQMMNATAKITDGSFVSNVLVGRQKNIKSGGGDGGVLTIGSAAHVSGRDLAWEVSGNGEIVLVLGKDGVFNPLDLTAATTDSALAFTQSGARLTVDGAALSPLKILKPITLIKYADGKGPTEQSMSNLVPNFTGFDKRFAPELIWTGTGLQLKVSK